MWAPHVTALDANMAGPTQGDEVGGVVLSFLITREGFNVMADQVSFAVWRAAFFVLAFISIPLANLKPYFGPARASKVAGLPVFPCPMLRSTMRLAIAGIEPHLARSLRHPFSISGVRPSFLEVAHCGSVLRRALYHSLATFSPQDLYDLGLRIYPSISVRNVLEAPRLSLLAILEHFFCTSTLACGFLGKAIITYKSIARRLRKESSAYYAGSLTVRGLGDIPSRRHDPNRITVGV